MAGRVEARLAELGLSLPEATAPMANYVPYVLSGPMAVMSGQIPVVDGKVAVTGLLGAEVDVSRGQEAARICFLNLLTHLRAACGGSLDRVRRVVRLGGFIASAPGFTGHALVMNGASDLAVAVFGDRGRHARSTVGVASLPGGAAVEVEGLFEVE